VRVREAAAAYLDTSVLTKWFVNEPGSEDVRDFMVAQKRLVISRLAVVEFNSALARLRRNRQITPAYEREAMNSFRHDLGRGVIDVEPMNDAHVLLAATIFERIGAVPLRTLDALHLASVIQLNGPTLATADRVMAQAARKLGLPCRFFKIAA
jgi:predicted nucleic acid-binding protein